MSHDEKIQEILLSQTRMEQQLNRLVSDAESEKETRKVRNKEIDRRLGDLEKWQAKWAGALITLGVLSTVLSIICAIIILTNKT